MQSFSKFAASKSLLRSTQYKSTGQQTFLHQYRSFHAASPKYKCLPSASTIPRSSLSPLLPHSYRQFATTPTPTPTPQPIKSLNTPTTTNKSYTKIPQPAPILPVLQPDIPYSKPILREFTPVDTKGFKLHSRGDFVVNQESFFSNLSHPIGLLRRNTRNFGLMFTIYCFVDYFYIHAILSENFFDSLFSRETIDIATETAKLHQEIHDLEQELEDKRYELTSAGKASMFSFDHKERSFAFSEALASISTRPLKDQFRQLQTFRRADSFQLDMLHFLQKQHSLGIEVTSWQYFIYYMTFHPNVVERYKQMEEKLNNNVSPGELLFDALVQYHPSFSPKDIFLNVYDRILETRQLLHDFPAMANEVQRMIEENWDVMYKYNAIFNAWEEDKIKLHLTWCELNNIEVVPEDVRVTPSHDLFELYRGERGYLTLGVLPPAFEKVQSPELKYKSFLGRTDYPEHGIEIKLNDFPTLDDTQTPPTPIPISFEFPNDFEIAVDATIERLENNVQIASFMSTQVSKSWKNSKPLDLAVPAYTV